MSGSIDLNTNKGIATMLGLCIVAGGGASALQQQVFGPGGEWGGLVSKVEVLTERIDTAIIANTNTAKSLEQTLNNLNRTIQEQSGNIQAEMRRVDGIQRETVYLSSVVESLKDEVKELKKNGG